MSKVTARAYSSTELRRIEEQCGADDPNFAERNGEPGDPETSGVVAGTGRIYKCAIGANLCFSDSTALVDRRRVDVLPRSLWVVHGLAGIGDCDLGSERRLQVMPGETVILAVHDSTPFAKNLRKGWRFKSLIAHASPEGIGDERLADALDGVLKLPGCHVVGRGDIMVGAARNLDRAGDLGGLAALAAETCATTLLARGLYPDQGWDTRLREACADTGVAARIARVRDTLLEEPESNHSLASLAKEAGVSVSTLKARFSATYGLSVYAFLKTKRLHLARQRLEQGALSVSEVAYRAGYSHPSNFSTAFREQFGVSPNSLRRRR